MTHERRITGDRRHRPTPAVSRYTFYGGRRSVRRRLDDPAAFYVDRLGGPTWLILLTVLLCQVLDAYLTLAHLSRGGEELNPIMGFLIERSEGLFVFVKLTVAVLGLLFLGVHKNFPLAKFGMALILVLFLGVVGWHCLLALQVG